MNRREILSLFLLGVLVSLGDAASSYSVQPTIHVRDWLRQWAMRRDRSGLAVIGQTAITLGLVEPNPDCILLWLENRIGNRWSPSEPKAHDQLLSNLIADDFANDCTIQMDGWVLSRSEVELCALAALS